MKGFKRHIAASIAITSVFLVCAIAIGMGAAPAKVIDETSKPQVAAAASVIVQVEQPVESATVESEAAPPTQAVVDSKPAAAVSNPVAVTPSPAETIAPQPEAAPAPDPELVVTPAVAPNPPINLTGTYMTKVPPYVRLTWTAPTGGSKVNHYHIYRTIVGGPVPMATTPLAETKNRNYNDYAIADYTLYRYWVTAVNSAGEESTPSNTVDVQTSSTAPCSPPQGVAAYVVDPGISIDWLPNTEKNLAGYNVYELRNNQWRKLNSSLLTDNHYYYASGIATRQYGVTAVNKSGIESTRTSVTPQATTPVIYEENNPSITVTGSWVIESYKGPSNGKIRVAGNAGARLNFPFSGSQVKLIVATYWTCGNARIYLDGSLYSTVSVYSYNTTYKVTAVSIPGVKRGSHTISVEVVGSGNPENAPYNFVNVDCFEVR